MKKLIKFYIHIYFLSCFPFFLFAQNNFFNGKVFDFETKEPLSFTNIFIEGKSIGTVSNSQGEFILDIEIANSNDSIIFSYMGYENFKISTKDIEEFEFIYLRKSLLKLPNVSIYAQNLSVKDIIKLIETNYIENYPQQNFRSQIFFHNYLNISFSKENELKLKKSNFEMLNKELVSDVFKMIPKEIIQYQDAIINLFSYNEKKKIQPIEGISLEEGSMKILEKKIDEKLTDLYSDFDESKKNNKVYYKVNSGLLFNVNIDDEELDSIEEFHSKDSLNYYIHTNYIKYSINSLMKQYSSIKSKNWEFITSPNKYKYEINLSVFNEELVYEINFKSEKNGLYQGIMYVNSDNYAILQLDYEYAPGKSNQNIRLFGLSHSMKNRGARVIFVKGDAGYYLKYIKSKKIEFASLNRNISLLKKEKKFLFDKVLNKIKLVMELALDIYSNAEILVLDKDELNKENYDKINEPKYMKFKKEFAYTPEMWENRTVIVPDKELKIYQRKNN
ncbi:MAG TPA: hypothetical protein EYQ68_03905 [Cytophagales bacterium]|jgi:hypothetical protein|nr:hypothetical protein [Cytophagales bacterium]